MVCWMAGRMKKSVIMGEDSASGRTGVEGTQVLTVKVFELYV